MFMFTHLILFGVMGLVLLFHFKLTFFCTGFYRACKDIITRLLEKNERRRLGSETGASEVKSHRWFGKVNWGLLRHTRPPVRRHFFFVVGTHGG